MEVGDPLVGDVTHIGGGNPSVHVISYYVSMIGGVTCLCGFLGLLGSVTLSTRVTIFLVNV